MNGMTCPVSRSQDILTFKGHSICQQTTPLSYLPMSLSPRPPSLGNPTMDCELLKLSFTRTASVKRRPPWALRPTANESVRYTQERAPFGKPLATNQGIQFPLVELATQAEMLRLLIRKTAWEMDRMSQQVVANTLSDKVAMCNYWANRLCCEAADCAM